MTMKQLHYTVRFNTPAFLGNAEQSAQWRTPPFKALLRQWWRVAYAADKNFSVNVDAMRREEGLLFGHAWLENDRYEKNGRQVATASRKSEIRMRLARWDVGRQKSWEGIGTVPHPEVSKPIGGDLYMGYGPLVFRNGAALKANAAIQCGESATLSLALQDSELPLIKQALWLMDRFGTIGSRSRNGWGSLSLTPCENTEELNGKLPSRDWKQCLAADWPHALGQSGNSLLVWQTTQPYDDWKALMKDLATIKIGLRTQTQFKFPTQRTDGQIHSRHWLSYPVTNHSVNAWGNNARLPNSLRFKVRVDEQNSKKLRAVIFHMPCLPPPEFRPNKQTVEQVWQQVHNFLSQQANLTRMQG
jgi:CRISPR-associated protein Cmr1